MIDQDKMRALAARHREEAELAEYANRNSYAAFMRESADAIDLLLAEVEQNRIDRLEAQGAFEEMDRENNRLRAVEATAPAQAKIDALFAGVTAWVNAHQIQFEAQNELFRLLSTWLLVPSLETEPRAELEAAAADKRDAERYRFIESKTKTFSLDMNGQHTYVVDFAIARLRGASLDQAVDAALAQRQGEGL